MNMPKNLSIFRLFCPFFNNQRVSLFKQRLKIRQCHLLKFPYTKIATALELIVGSFVI
jgi:hypothetical protein